MFEFDFSVRLRKKLKKLAKKDKIIARIFQKKYNEVINRNSVNINSYKNLRSPLNEFKRIHLTDNYILLFKVEKEINLITFVDILHWDNAY